MRDPPRAGLLDAVVRLGRALRERDVPVTPSEIVDAARALEAVDLADRGRVYLALRTVLLGRVEDYPVFDRVFADLWRDPGPDDLVPAEIPAPGPPRAAPAPHLAAPGAATLARWLGRDADDAEPAGLPTMGRAEVLDRKDFSDFDPDQLDAVTRLARRIARRLAARPSRRWKSGHRGERVDPRHTLRRSFRTGGDPVELSYRTRRTRKTKLVVLCDVSGSMDLYSRFLLQFLYALQNCFARVETFVFSTGLARITAQLAGGSYRQALDRLQAERLGWSGGTRIGESLRAFIDRYDRLLDRRTVVVILSDGWDTGEPAVLAGALRHIRKRAGRVVWLNPLLGNPDYRPVTRGMAAALPHIDVFAPGHNLESLERVTPHLLL